MKIAFVTPWGDKSSVGDYALELVPRIASHYQDFRIFAEELKLSPPRVEANVERCWKRGDSLAALIKSIHNYKPDVIYIEHQYGLFPDQQEWLEFIKAIKPYNHFVKMHCTYKTPVTLVTHEKKQGIGGLESGYYLGNLKHIIVHTNEAAMVLAGKQLLGDGTPLQVSVIPHGFTDYSSSSSALTQYPHLFSFGFGLRYKGLENAVEIAEGLLPRYPNLLYVGVFGDEPRRSVSSQHYFDGIKNLIAKKGLEKHFLLFRGYKDIVTLQKFAQLCTIALFPYTESPSDREVYGASGAVRIAMAWGLPVVASYAPLFADLEGIVSRGKTIQEMQEHVHRLCSQPQERDRQIEAQKDFVQRNHWDRIAEEHYKLFSTV